METVHKIQISKLHYSPSKLEIMKGYMEAARFTIVENDDSVIIETKDPVNAGYLLGRLNMVSFLIIGPNTPVF